MAKHGPGHRPDVGRHVYYLAPRGEEFAQVYALLAEGLEDSGRAAVATLVMRGKEDLTAVRSTGDVLELHSLHWADEVTRARNCRSYPNAPGYPPSS